MKKIIILALALTLVSCGAPRTGNSTENDYTGSSWDVRVYENNEHNTTCYLYRDSIFCVKN